MCVKSKLKAFRDLFDLTPCGKHFLSPRFLKLLDDPSMDIKNMVLDTESGLILEWGDAVIELELDS